MKDLNPRPLTFKSNFQTSELNRRFNNNMKENGGVVHRVFLHPRKKFQNQNILDLGLVLG